jgi:hypothetical protein
MTVPPTSTEAAVITRIPDVLNQPLGKPTSATAAIRDRILRKKGVEVPVAAFQSSI